jgi:hypothetical protein
MYNDGINVHDLLRLEKDKLDEEIEKGILETKPNALGGSNSSYLPCNDNNVSMIERTVCFDPDSIDILTDKIKPVSRLLHARIYDLSPDMPEGADLQDKIYGHIRNAFAKACIPGQENLDSQAVREAWLLCMQETQNANGVLDAAWKRQEPNGYADRTSRCYEDLLGSACTWMQQP